MFPFYRAKEKQPRTTNMLMLTEDHLRPAAVAMYLTNAGIDPKTVQGLLRHADVTTTLGIYAHSKNEARFEAQADMIAAFFAAAGNTPTEARNGFGG